MNAVGRFVDLIGGRPPRVVESGILSLLPASAPGQRYDGRARLYDRLVGNGLYNRIVWGASTDEYRAFARRAVEASRAGWLLDAGCGTLVFTAEAYASTPQRAIVAADQSIDMLRAARDRLAEVAGRVPDNVIFLQADVFEPRFLPDTFQTVLSMGMLHLFDSAEPLLNSLSRCLAPGGQLFLSSLVENDRVGDLYMKFLHRAGELGRPRSVADLQALLRHELGSAIEFSVTGNMSYMVAKNV